MLDENKSRDEVYGQAVGTMRKILQNRGFMHHDLLDGEIKLGIAVATHIDSRRAEDNADAFDALILIAFQPYYN